MPTTTPTATSIGTRPELHLQPLELATLHALLRHHLPTHALYAYGSRVVGWPASQAVKPYSDLDLVVCSPAPALALANLRADLEDSDLPWRVDLCVWDDLPAWLQTLIAQHGCPLEPSQG
jgi:hypothetical protein